MSQPTLADSPQTMSTESDSDSDAADDSTGSNRELSEDPGDGRLFGDTRRRDDEERGALDTSFIPDSASDSQAEIIRYAMLNPDASNRELWNIIIEKAYDGDKEAAPSESWVYKTLQEYDGIKRPDGRLGNTTPDSGSDADDGESGESSDETVRSENGTGSYEGPADGLDLTEQPITERPHKPGAEDSAEESSETPSGAMEALKSDLAPDVDAGDDESPERASVRLSKDEIVRLLARCGDGDEDLIEVLASHV
jgi:hypothetical protein